MTTVLQLDGNIYDRLAADDDARGQLRDLIQAGLVRVIATPIIIDELAPSRFKGLPSWFPIDIDSESVAVVEDRRGGQP